MIFGTYKELIDYINTFPTEKEKLDSIIQYFLDNDVTENVILKIGMNRKSSERGLCQYDKPYHLLYTAIRDFQVNHSKENVVKIFNAISSIKGNSSRLWKHYLFTNTKRISIERCDNL